jgi:hypothetical protein
VTDTNTRNVNRKKRKYEELEAVGITQKRTEEERNENGRVKGIRKRKKKKNVAYFWDVTPCNVVECYQCIRELGDLRSAEMLKLR